MGSRLRNKYTRSQFCTNHVGRGDPDAPHVNDISACQGRHALHNDIILVHFAISILFLRSLVAAPYGMFVITSGALAISYAIWLERRTALRTRRPPREVRRASRLPPLGRFYELRQDLGFYQRVERSGKARVKYYGLRPCEIK